MSYSVINWIIPICILCRIIYNISNLYLVLIGGVPLKEENQPKIMLPPETLATMLACLQGCAG